MVGIQFLNNYLKKPELVNYEVAGNMPVIPMMGVPEDPRGVLDHPALEGRPTRGVEYRNDLRRMFPEQPGGLGIPPGMPGYEMDRKIPPAGLVEAPADYEVAGGLSFDIGAGGDARRSRKGLSVEDVQRLIQAYPQDADKIRKMYLPGPQAPGFLMRGV